ncbi:hypothetical protein [Chryseobacterium sp. MYb328]|uniref:hypothetical protein n=1 Tax=Chryseobacterium sp. MYb328 TaxID=2745231 RepID=UPI0030A88A8C
MIQFLLILLGFIDPNSNANTTNIDPVTITANSISIGNHLDTSGETTQTPPKK